MSHAGDSVKGNPRWLGAFSRQGSAPARRLAAEFRGDIGAAANLMRLRDAGAVIATEVFA